MAGAALPALSAPAVAQDAATADGEILVTAQRRVERIQDVPVAVSAFSGQELSTLGITQLSQIGQVTPGVVINQLSGFSEIFVRGVGGEFLQPAVNQTIATYVDGFIIQYPAASNQSFLDVERVEVLKGPQGTLYGRNATGGAINIITRKPPEDFALEAKATIGNYARKGGDFYVGGGLGGSGLSASIAAFIDHRNAYYKNIGGPKIEDTERSGVRGKLLYRGEGGMEVELTGSYQHQTRAEVHAHNQFQANSLGAVLFGTPGTDRPYRTSIDTDVSNKLEEWFGGLRLLLPLGGADLVSLTGYRKTDNPLVNDYDTTLAPAVFFDAVLKDRTFSQEFQLLSNNESRLKWVVGLYYFYNKGSYDPLIIGAFGAPAHTVNVGTMDSYAAYGQATYDLGGGLAMTAGARYTHDKVKLKGVSVSGAPFFGGRSDGFNDFSPKLSLQYKSGDTLVYLSGSKGYKGPSYNISSVQPLPADNDPVKPENLYAAELGVKTRLADGIRAEAAIFHYHYKNVQTQYTPSATAPLAFINAPLARIQGVEGNITAKPTRDLQLSVGATWLFTAEYRKFPQGNGYEEAPFGNTVVTLDFKGNRLPRAPKLSGNVGGAYTFRFGEAGSLTANANAAYTTAYWLDSQNTPRAKQKGYTIVNGSLVYRTVDEKWSATLWADNLFDKKYLAFKTISGLGIFGQYAPPRMFGLTLGYKY